MNIHLRWLKQRFRLSKLLYCWHQFWLVMVHYLVLLLQRWISKLVSATSSTRSLILTYNWSSLKYMIRAVNLLLTCRRLLQARQKFWSSRYETFVQMQRVSASWWPRREFVNHAMQVTHHGAPSWEVRMFVLPLPNFRGLLSIWCHLCALQHWPEDFGRNGVGYRNQLAFFHVCRFFSVI